MASIKRLAASIMFVGCILVVAFSGSLTSAGGSDSAKDKLTTISWIQGSWKATVDGDHLDEFWSPPHADSMIGMFRWAKKDGLWMTEMLSIVTEGDNIVLRIKHFDRAMVGWEGKDKPLTLPLVSQSDDESVFESPDKAERLTYQKSGSDTMDILLEVKGKEKDRRSEFHYKRLGG